MSEHPRHPESHDHVDADRADGPPGSSRGMYAFMIIGVLIVLGVVALHITGLVGPGSH